MRPPGDLSYPCRYRRASSRPLLAQPAWPSTRSSHVGRSGLTASSSRAVGRQPSFQFTWFQPLTCTHPHPGVRPRAVSPPPAPRPATVASGRPGAMRLESHDVRMRVDQSRQQRAAVGALRPRRPARRDRPPDRSRRPCRPPPASLPKRWSFPAGIGRVAVDMVDEEICRNCGNGAPGGDQDRQAAKNRHGVNPIVVVQVAQAHLNATRVAASLRSDSTSGRGARSGSTGRLMMPASGPHLAHLVCNARDRTLPTRPRAYRAPRVPAASTQPRRAAHHKRDLGQCRVVVVLADEGIPSCPRHADAGPRRFDSPRDRGLVDGIRFNRFAADLGGSQEGRPPGESRPAD